MQVLRLLQNIRVEKTLKGSWANCFFKFETGLWTIYLVFTFTKITQK